MIYCQIMVLCLLFVRLFMALHTACCGRKEIEPPGYVGVVIVLVIITLVFLCYWKAGSFSLLF